MSAGLVQPNADMIVDVVDQADTPIGTLRRREQGLAINHQKFVELQADLAVHGADAMDAG